MFIADPLYEHGNLCLRLIKFEENEYSISLLDDQNNYFADADFYHENHFKELANTLKKCIAAKPDPVVTYGCGDAKDRELVFVKVGEGKRGNDFVYFSFSKTGFKKEKMITTHEATLAMGKSETEQLLKNLERIIELDEESHLDVTE